MLHLDLAYGSVRGKSSGVDPDQHCERSIYL
jgi:hypothetical protein